MLYRALPLLLILTACKAPYAEIRPQQVEGGPLQIGCRADVTEDECQTSAKKLCEVIGKEISGYRRLSSLPTGKYSHEFSCVVPGKGIK